MTVDVAGVVRIAKANLDARRVALRSHLAHTGPPPGLVRVDDATFMAAVQGMIDQYPPMPLSTPDGREIVESPWIVMLAYVDGGRDVLDRMLSIQAKMAVL